MSANRGPFFPIMKYTFFGVELLGVKLLACTVDQLRPFVNTEHFIQLVRVQFLVQGVDMPTYTVGRCRVFV